MTSCENASASGLHPILRTRVSPRVFDPDAVVSAAQVDSLLEAARLAPSAGNSQPWAFVVGRRGDEVHSRIVEHLAASSVGWASQASLLVVNLARVLIDETDWEYSEFAHYDLGQAVAHMTIQAFTIGISAHQFRAFDRDAVAAEFGVPTSWEATSMTAFGQMSEAHDGPRGVAGTSRQRRSPTEITWARV